MKNNIIVIKFGGTSVGSAKGLNNIQKIIIQHLQQYDKVIVVLSAFTKITDLLKSLSREDNKQEIISNIKKNHEDIISQLDLNQDQVINIKNILNQLIVKLENLINQPNSNDDEILSYGEIISTQIFYQILNVEQNDKELISPFNLIIKKKSEEQYLDDELTNTNIQKSFKPDKKVFIVPGFIASTADGTITTLGRGGSDYTATILGSFLKSSIAEIWSDVDGFMTANPKYVPDAKVIRSLNYREAFELSHFGAKIIYPPSLIPALTSNITVKIKNTFNPGKNGTLITTQQQMSPYHEVTGISSIDNISLINVQGTAMIGQAGFSQKVFNILGKEKINIILISQASSEYSICFAVENIHAEKCKKLLDNFFKEEIRNNLVEETSVISNLSIIAVVGSKMSHTPGVSGKLFSILGDHKINICAIAQGSSEINISLVVETKNLKKALSCIHQRFFNPKNKEINLFFLGPGTVGKTLLNQFHHQKEKLLNYNNLQINIIGICNSSGYIIKEQGIDLTNWKNKIKKQENHLHKFIDEIISHDLPNRALIDCTSSEEHIERYSEMLLKGVSIITPNKKAMSSNDKIYKTIKNALEKSSSEFYYETNVGAGLPIVSTIKQLILSGDKIMEIEGVLSGTLSYLFNEFDGSIPFSKLVKIAQEKGYTEPDPRDDLNGMDVARKALILSREIGINAELSDIIIETPIPNTCFKTNSVQEFYEKLESYDKEMDLKIQRCKKEGKKLCYIAKIKDGNILVSLQEIVNNHPFFHLSSTDNIIKILSERYNQNPMIIRGPGAGPEVTAAGIFSDIIQFSHIQKINNISKDNIYKNVKYNNCLISLIGMSNIGKTKWSKELENIGFHHICCDEIIEERMVSDHVLPKKIGLNGVANWMGSPDQMSYQIKQNTYLNYENEALLDSLNSLKKQVQNTVVDTTGSVIHLQNEILERLKNETLVVYIKADKDYEESLIKNFILHPKPVVWGDYYKNNLENDYRTLLHERDLKYTQMADVTIYANELQSMKASGLISLIENKIRKER